jgi:sister-chromatid-cohesion protein PDS5
VKEPAAYELCKELWMAASGDLEPFLQSLYSSSLGGGIGTDEEKEPCLAIQHINDIILELHRIAPTVLNTILPQMEYRLKVEEEEVRCETAQLLGRMFAEQSSLLAQENKALWQSFCGRFQDVSGKVRSECVRVSQFLLVYHPEMRKATTEKLELCLLDGLDEIRLLTVQSVLAAAKENIDSVSKQLLSNAAERIRDKKFVVRQAAVRGLARLYNHILRSNGESINEPVQHVLWIPLKIFNCYYLQSIQDRLLVEQSLHMQLLPSWVEGEDGRQMTDDKHRTKRLLIMYCSLDDSARR